jgi:hypothetical protein
VCLDRGSIDRLARIRLAPALAAAELEHLVEQGERIAGQLWAGAAAAHARHQPLDMHGLDSVERPVAQMRHEARTQQRTIGAQRRWLAADSLQVTDELVTDLLHASALSRGYGRNRRLDLPPQLALGLGTGQALTRTGLAHDTDPALQLLAADAPLAVPGVSPASIAANEQGAGAIGATSHVAILIQGLRRASGPNSVTAHVATSFHLDPRTWSRP